MNVRLCSLSASRSSIFVTQFQCLQTWIQDRLCLNQAIQFRYCWMRNFVLMPTVDVMLEMFAFRNQILFSQVCVVKGSQFTATVFNCLDVYVSQVQQKTEQAVYFFISCQSVWQSCNERINYCQICIHSEFVARSKNCVRCWTFQERYSKAAFTSSTTAIGILQSLAIAWAFDFYSNNRSRSDSVNSLMTE